MIATVRIKNVDFSAQREDLSGTETEGICVKVDFELIGAKGKSGVVAVFFTKPDSSYLKDTDNKYRSVAGEVTVQNKIKPGYDHAVYNDEELFIPYSQLDLGRGRHDLHIQVQILMESGTEHAHIASADPYWCWVRIN